MNLCGLSMADTLSRSIVALLTELQFILLPSILLRVLLANVQHLLLGQQGLLRAFLREKR